MKKYYAPDLKTRIVLSYLGGKTVSELANENKISRSTTIYEFKNIKYHICVVLDLYARKVISHAIGLNNSTLLTKRAQNAAYYERMPKAGLILHTDQGTNYTSSAFQKCAKELNIIQSISRASNPYDNTVMESFFKTLKLEELYRKNYRSERELKESIARYIHFYNSERVHSMTFYRSPDKKALQCNTFTK